MMIHLSNKMPNTGDLHFMDVLIGVEMNFFLLARADEMAILRILAARQQGQEDLHSDFYQTIIRNNLFAPLGTDLHQKPAPGATLTLVGTFVSEDPTHSTALIKNETTNQQARFVIGEIFDDFQVVEIQPKQVTLDHNG